MVGGGLVEGVEKFAEGLAGVVTKSVDATTNVANFVKGLGILNDRLREAVPLLGEHNEALKLTPGLAAFITAGLGDLVQAVAARSWEGARSVPIREDAGVAVPDVHEEVECFVCGGMYGEPEV